MREPARGIIKRFNENLRKARKKGTMRFNAGMSRVAFFFFFLLLTSFSGYIGKISADDGTRDKFSPLRNRYVK